MADTTAHGAAYPEPHAAPAPAAAAHEEGQHHPLKVYFIVWGWLFVLSACSYMVDYVGLPPRADGRQLITVGPDQTKEVRVMVTDYSTTPPAPSTTVLFTLIDIDSGATAQMRDHFFGP